MVVSSPHTSISIQRHEPQPERLIFEITGSGLYYSENEFPFVGSLMHRETTGSHERRRENATHGLSFNISYVKNCFHESLRAR